VTLLVPTPSELATHVGEHLGPTDWTTIDQDRIDRFAEATGDHADGGAQGYLVLSLANLFLPELVIVEHFSMGVNVGVEMVRFPSRVGAGSRIRGAGEILSVVEIGEGTQVVVRITIEIDGEQEPACVVDTVSRFFP
jgi:acyl dehydratase